MLCKKSSQLEGKFLLAHPFLRPLLHILLPSLHFTLPRLHFTRPLLPFSCPCYVGPCILFSRPCLHFSRPYLLFSRLISPFSALALPFSRVQVLRLPIPRQPALPAAGGGGRRGEGLSASTPARASGRLAAQPPRWPARGSVPPLSCRICSVASSRPTQLEALARAAGPRPTREPRLPSSSRKTTPAVDAPGPPGPRKGACSRAGHHPIPLAATGAMVGGLGAEDAAAGPQQAHPSPGRS